MSGTKRERHIYYRESRWKKKKLQEEVDTYVEGFLAIEAEAASTGVVQPPSTSVSPSMCTAQPTTVTTAGAATCLSGDVEVDPADYGQVCAIVQTAENAQLCAVVQTADDDQMCAMGGQSPSPPASPHQVMDVEADQDQQPMHVDGEAVGLMALPPMEVPVDNDVHDDNCDGLDGSDGGGSPPCSDEDDGLHLPDDNFEGGDIVSQLIKWHNECNVSMNSTTKLLKVLRSTPFNPDDLPADCRKLLQTPREQVGIVELGGGQYKYWGLSEGIIGVLKHERDFVHLNNAIELHCNIDGLRIYKSSTRHLWPILCQFNNFCPFIVCLWLGRSKPSSLDEFLRDFLTEFTQLERCGIIYQGKLFQVSLKCLICDAVARSWLKCVIAYNGYFGCERCSLSGTWLGRVVYNTQMVGVARTDEYFRQMRYTHHQPNEDRVSPFATAGIGCVTQFVLDFMHMIPLGVIKRILDWLKTDGDLVGQYAVRLSQERIQRVTHLLRHYSSQMPTDFARRPRGLDDLKFWKATEFRMFMLYLAPVVIRPPIVSQDLYHHFMRLSVGISLLLERDNIKRNRFLHYARELLRAFVVDCQHIYGPKFTVYNVHSVQHIPDDVEKFNLPLDQISAFPFENHLGKLKKLIRSGHNPIAQVYRRLSEMERVALRRMGHPVNRVRANTRDGCFLLEDNNYAFVQTVLNDGEYRCEILNKRFLAPLFNDPCDSRLLHIGVAQDFRQKCEPYAGILSPACRTSWTASGIVMK